MCTLTIYSGKKRCVVTMNRDERRTRKESGVLYSRSSAHARVYYPVDISSGGTWFGVNNKGVILCLLNRYQEPEIVGAVSRGDIIPRALEQGNFDAVADWLLRLNHRQYNPFDLFLISRKRMLHGHWNGKSFAWVKPVFKHWYLFASSGIMTEEVLAFRQNIFQAWNQEMGKKLIDADEIIRGFHLIQIEGMESYSVLMEREFSHTKSIIQADLDSKTLKLKYIPDVLEKRLDATLADVQMETIQVLKG